MRRLVKWLFRPVTGLVDRRIATLQRQLESVERTAAETRELNLALLDALAALGETVARLDSPRESPHESARG